MQNGKQIATGVAIGYLLGRTKKMKLALMLGAAAMGSRLDLKSLAGKGASLLEASPGAQRLTSEVRGKLGDSGRAAAVALAGKGMDAFSDKLQSRADRLRSGGSDEAEEPEADESEADEPETNEPETEEPEAEAEEQPKSRRRRSSGGNSNSNGSSSSGGGRTSKRTSGTRKRASSTAKRASGTRQRRSRTNG